MNEMNILFSLDDAKQEYKGIEISVENELENNLDYKFLVGLDGAWDTLKKSSGTSVAIWKPAVDGKYSIMVQAKRKESNKPFDFMSRTDYIIGESYEKLIKDIYIDKMEIMVGEKITLTVDTLNVPIMYRYWVHERDDWQLLADYSPENIMTWISKYSGKKEFLVECKNINSKNMFDDSMKIGFNVQAIQALEIMSFECLTESILEGTEIVFEVETKYEDNRVVLYKFVKIDLKGNRSCIQDYSTKKLVSYVETNRGNYKLLCMAKDMFSRKEFDDRALIYYNVDPYEEIGKETVKIDDIIIDKKDNVLIGDRIHLTVKATGGDSLRYSFLVFKDDKETEKIEFGIHDFVDFIPEESGSFKLEVRVKDKYSKSEFDTSKSVYIKALDCIPAKIDYILMDKNKYYMVYDTIPVQVIYENTSDTLINYVLKIDDKVVEQTSFIEYKNYELKPKCSGSYAIEILVKNKLSTSAYDSRKEVKIEVHKSLPITDTKILCDNENFIVNETITFKSESMGGKDVVYEFYIMKKGNWSLVQKFSKKDDYSFIPFHKGIYKMLVLSKSFYKSISYEDYDIIEIEVKE
ncbi:triple tyrosine motif-containing protein [Clostridium estertheticum]|uniref:Two component regulator three Y domain-containing protein n=1 Tax=Clostridium estertheticum TaxID=238834 RepID=A0AA47EG91_9CLOT|nr:triple tyrosine motif-containing protein [Clostridium estertheticum]MBU3157785.1 hypothetical protein [Clostridium estertheticum]WAG59441.1 hypothetical protein LL038_17615 [Clostridium estertheticum]